MIKKKLSLKGGFTLVELLVVMAILGILTTIIAGGFRTAQLRGRDAQRKSDLKELANSLELFFADYGTYPPADTGGIAGCPYDPATSLGSRCDWGIDEFTDTKTVYFKVMPIDPTSNQFYVYQIVAGSNNQKYQVFAHLENPQDNSCLGGDCLNPPVAISCGSGLACNFAVTSANTSPTE